jgi:hypothetical protein
MQSTAHPRADPHRRIVGFNHGRAYSGTRIECDLADDERRGDRLRLMHVHRRVRCERSVRTQFDVAKRIAGGAASFAAIALAGERNEPAL